MKFRELIFHIGLHKTGSTSIQNWLLKHRELLERKYDIYYPSFAANHSFHFNSWFHAPLPINHLNVQDGAFTPEAVAEANARRMQEFMREAEASTASRVLISAETLSQFHAENLQNLIEWAHTIAGRVRVVVFLRHPGEWLASLMQENLKGKRPVDDMSLIRRGLDSVVDSLDRWRELVGKDAFHLRDFREACESEAGLLGTFCSLAQISPEVTKEAGPLVRSNESLSAEGATVLAVINARPDITIHDWTSLSAYKRMVQMCREIKGHRFTVPETFMQKVPVAFKSGVDRLKADYGIEYDLENYDTPGHGLSTLTSETAESLAKLIVRIANSSHAEEITREKARTTQLREEKKALKLALQHAQTEGERSLVLKLVNPLLKFERSIHKRIKRIHGDR